MKAKTTTKILAFPSVNKKTIYNRKRPYPHYINIIPSKIIITPRDSKAIACAKNKRKFTKKTEMLNKEKRVEISILPRK